jgi:hypothetical protein
VTRVIERRDDRSPCRAGDCRRAGRRSSLSESILVEKGKSSVGLTMSEAGPYVPMSQSYFCRVGCVAIEEQPLSSPTQLVGFELISMFDDSVERRKERRDRSRALDIAAGVHAKHDRGPSGAGERVSNNLGLVLIAVRTAGQEQGRARHFLGSIYVNYLFWRLTISPLYRRA